MGSSTSKNNETNYIKQIKEIDENELDMSKIDRWQLQVIKKNDWKNTETRKRKANKNDLCYAKGRFM